PEIALHVRWQKRLIKDLVSIAPDNQFIIATHSPTLVKENWRSKCIEVGV
ncbi:ABC transporter ATP-binding protein, partial [Vibrio parahaemolyticus]